MVTVLHPSEQTTQRVLLRHISGKGINRDHSFDVS
jgi:hypothetical protein